MRYFKVIVFSVLVALAVIFMFQNFTALTQPLELKLDLGVWEFGPREFPSYVLLLLAFFVGLVVAIAVGLVERIRLRSQLSSTRKELERVRSELEGLRKLAVEEQVPAAGEGPSEDQQNAS